MDPVTLASKRFQRDFDHFWAPPPGAEAPGPRVLRLAFDHSERKEVLKTLRLLEWQPGNKRPFVVVEAHGESEQEILALAAARLEADYRALARGLAEDGVALASLPAVAVPLTKTSVAHAFRAAAEQVARVLDGLVVVWLVDRVFDAAFHAEMCAALGAVSDGSILRVAVGDAPNLNATYPGIACFEVDQPALLQYLKDLGREKTAGPSGNKPTLSPAEKASIERELGRPMLSEATGFDLRAYLLDAAAALTAQNFKLAARKLRAARMLCRGSSLHTEEAMVSIALGTAVFSMGDKQGAIAAYRNGRSIAVSQGNNALAAQAELGVAAVELATTAYARARESYAEVMKLAADLPALRLEAMRMEGECFVLENKPSNAIRSLGELLDIAEALPPEVRAGTSYAFGGRTLVAVLTKQGQSAAATTVKRRLEALGVADVRGADRRGVEGVEASP